MKSFEISSQVNKNGRRHFKAVLYEIFPDSCIDVQNKVGTQYNLNGITWIREYCEAALPSIKGMSLRCEFIDENRTTLCGHGETDIKDGLPIFENAVVIGTFTNGYIEDIETDEGTKTVCIGEGEIDSQCYNNFVTKLEEDMANGYAPHGSIEIMRTNGNESIIYKFGYVDKGRIPITFEHSGYALLGVEPADHMAQILELNKKEEKNTMNEAEIKALVMQIVSEINSQAKVIEDVKADCEKKVAEANAAVEAVTAEKNELVATVEQLQAAIEANKAERKELDEKWETLFKEAETLRKALGEAKAKERLAELSQALSQFTDDEQKYAVEEIKTFKENPVEGEINSITDKILVGIGKKAKEDEAKSSEINAKKKEETLDIFSGVITPSESDEEIKIY